MGTRMLRRAGLWAALGLFALTSPSHAETGEVRLSKGFGIHYLPMYVMEQQKLLEKHAAAAGLGEIKTSWQVIDGGNVINDAMLSGALDIASAGVPGFLTLWAKAKGIAKLEILSLGAVGGGSLYLNSRNPAVKTLADLTERDRIALPGIKTSYAAVVLQMAAAQAFGDANYDKLDPLTVGMPYPEALAALVSGKTEITAHVVSPPFSYMELEHPEIHRVFNSVDVLGKLTVIMAFTTRAFHDANPRLSAAFAAALDEAGKFITKDPAAAARLYVAVAPVKTSEAQVLQILADPDTNFSPTPAGMMKFADFLHRAGTIRTMPTDWKALFFPEVGGLAGS